MNKDILTIKNLHKSFGGSIVLDGLNLSVPRGSVFGFIGQNGAGKTTTMKIILGLLAADSGEVLVDGQKVAFGNTPTNKCIGYLPDVPAFYGYMKANEYLKFCGNVSGMKGRDLNERINELLSLTGLEAAHGRVGGFSRGMKQRLGIAQALLARPKLLICDEPTSALDPLGRKELLELLSQIRNETTVIFSTHILGDVERICDDVALLHKGKIAFSGSIAEIKAKHGEPHVVVEIVEPTLEEVFLEVIK